MSLYLDELTVFDRINLAACAMRRAQVWCEVLIHLMTLALTGKDILEDGAHFFEIVVYVDDN